MPVYTLCCTPEELREAMTARKLCKELMYDIHYIIDYMDAIGLLSEHCFCLPNGSIYDAKVKRETYTKTA